MRIGHNGRSKVQAQLVDGVDVVHVIGDIDADITEELAPLVSQWAQRADRAVVLDLTGVTFLGSAGLHLLIGFSVRAH
ncbi:STAS domain-containing protein [Lentzea sp. HUAS12]|uniref:STAS domain-containing protein n=1 Tax=Lentzea sp. HUAS12 TaxID=2951806 RepID=UPI0020A02DE8|nr:STAS domain-containing protein [Lentzea sp. HUAS12]USX56393.1 STAS domain-containing protein [Lentzea sp. HUAS12]